MRLIPSSIREALSPMGTPTLVCSSMNIWLLPRPAPTPRIVRPAEMLSIVAREWARWTGCRSAFNMTAVPILTRLVRAPKAAMTVRGSSLGLEVMLSPTHTESKPILSAVSAICQFSSIRGPALWAWTRTPRVGNKTPMLSRDANSFTCCCCLGRDSLTAGVYPHPNLPQ